jgi:hypothetical protein
MGTLRKMGKWQGKKEKKMGPHNSNILFPQVSKQSQFTSGWELLLHPSS